MTLLIVMVQKNDEIFKDLIQAVGVYVTIFTVFFFIRYLKKERKKKKKH